MNSSSVLGQIPSRPNVDVVESYNLVDATEIELLMQKITQRHGFNVKYIKTTKPAFLNIEKSIAIKPVAVINKGFGVFITKDFHIKPHETLVLGEYLGYKTTQEEVNHSSQYCFNLRDGYVMDAEKHRNWLAIVNSPITETAANVFAQWDEKLQSIVYVMRGGDDGLKIKKGTQLLVYYGPNFIYDDNKRFLRFTDSSLDTRETYTAYQSQYMQDALKLEDDFLALFKHNPHHYFILPNRKKVENIDQPFLACSQAREYQAHFLSQYEHENLTLLMLACWLGDKKEIKSLLDAGANPNLQSSITGQTALHVLVLSSKVDSTSKIELIHLLLEAKTHLNIQDFENNTVLHKAIEVEDVALTEFLIATDNSLLNYINKYNQDAFAFAIKVGNLQIVEIFSNIIQNSYTPSSHSKQQKKLLHDFLVYYLERDPHEGLEHGIVRSSRLVHAFDLLAESSCAEDSKIQILETLKHCFTCVIAEIKKTKAQHLLLEELNELDKIATEKLAPKAARVRSNVVLKSKLKPQSRNKINTVQPASSDCGFFDQIPRQDTSQDIVTWRPQ